MKLLVCEERRIPQEKCRSQKTTLRSLSFQGSIQARGLNSGHQAWHQVFLPHTPSHPAWETNLNNWSHAVGPLGSSFYLPMSLKEVEKSRLPNVLEFCVLDSYPRSSLLTQLICCKRQKPNLSRKCWSSASCAWEQKMMKTDNKTDDHIWLTWIGLPTLSNFPNNFKHTNDYEA